MSIRVESLPRQESQIKDKPRFVVLKGGLAQDHSLPPKQTLSDNSRLGTENPLQLAQHVFTQLLDEEIDGLKRKTKFNIELARTRAKRKFNEFVESNVYLSEHVNSESRLQVVTPKV